MDGLATAKTAERQELNHRVEAICEMVQRRLFAPATVHFIARALHLQAAWRNLTVPLIIWLFLCFIGAGVAVVFGPRLTYLGAAAGVGIAFSAALSIAIISGLHDSFFFESVRDLMTNAGDDSTVTAMERWFARYVSVRWQLPLPLLCCGVVLLYLHIERVQLTATVYILVSVAAFYMEHGAFLALFIPTLARTIGRHRMKLFWLAPAETTWLQRLSHAFNTLCLFEGVGFSMWFIGIYSLQGREGILTSGENALAKLPLVWLILGVCTILYAFLFPQYHLSRVIVAEKARQRETLQSLLETYRAQFSGLSEAQHKELSHLLDLTTRIAAARETAIDTKAASTFITSLVLPITTFVVGQMKVLDFLK